jgi:hypothetical protein
MRALHKAWQDKRPGWTRRVRWFQGTGEDIRLEFTDEERKVNVFFDSPEEAQRWFDSFVQGTSAKALTYTLKT